MRRPLPTRLLALLCASSVYVGSALLGTGAMAQTPSPAPAPAAKAPADKAAPPTAATPAPAPTPPQAARPAPAAPAPAAAPQAPAPVPKASGPSVEEIVKPVNGLQSAIEAAEKNLEQSPSQRDLAALRTSIEKIENNAKDAGEKLRRPPR